MLCKLIAANKREAFRDGFKAAERLRNEEVDQWHELNLTN